MDCINCCKKIPITLEQEYEKWANTNTSVFDIEKSSSKSSSKCSCGGSNSLDKDPPKSPPSTKTEYWALTISPPKYDNRECELYIYLYLKPLEYLIEQGYLTAYCEFAQGRLHYHCNVRVPDEQYGLIYRIITSTPEMYKVRGDNQYKIKYIKPVGESRKIVYMKKYTPRAMIKYVLSTNDKWLEYCTKESDKTQKILGKFSIINSNNWLNLKLYIRNKFSIVNI